MHHASFSDPDFQRSFAAEPRAYCASCHAPERDAADGIGCASCHDLGAEHPRPQPSGTARRAPDCTRCHDFVLPGSAVFLQTTAQEHRASAAAGTPCIDCHMPSREGHRDHRFAASRDPKLLGDAVWLRAVRFEDGELHVELAGRAVGHRFPTGDLFRSLSIVVRGADAEGAFLCAETFSAHRDWDGHRGSLQRRPEQPAADTRLGDEPRLLRVRCSAKPETAHVNVVYQRGASAHGEWLDIFEELEIFDRVVPLAR